MKPAPDPKEVQHFQFKESGSRQVCEALKPIPRACSLLATDCKRGLIYAAHRNSITVLPCSESPPTHHLQHSLPLCITRISLSCDFSYLGVTFASSTAHIYSASSLSKHFPELLHEIQLSSSPQSVFAYDLKWNPSIPGNFCTISSDDSIGSFSLKLEQKSTVSITALEKIQGLSPTCVAWSPKGKQLVVGCKNGSIIQLKPELKVARSLPGPSPSLGEALEITWISNYQFCAAYSDPSDRRINVLIIDAPKGEATATFTNYEDITFGMPPGEDAPRYYMEHIPEWNVILAGSSCSSEVALLGSNDNGVSWEQWLLIDSGRAGLPCIRGDETFPVGISIDKSPQEVLPWDDGGSLPHPMPMLHIFDNSGRMMSFHMVNLAPSAPTLCSAPWEPVTIASPPPPQEQTPRTSLLPSEISFAVSSAVTSTPRPKASEIVGVKPQVAANLFEERMRSAAGQGVVPPAPPAGQPQLPQSNQKPRADLVESVQKVESRPPKDQGPPPPEKPLIDESICLRVYREEHSLFESELKQKLEPQTFECGTDDEKKRLTVLSTQIEDFLGELRETTSSLSSDISYLKALLLQSFAWIEETKSRNSSNPLDNRERHDKTKIKELQRSYFNTQSQLVQATKALDMDWAECQLREKSKMKIPSLEFVYQSLKRHAEIIAKEKANLEVHIQKWRVLSRSSRVTSLNRSMSKLSLGKGSLSAVNGASVDGIEIRCRTIASNTKNFSRDKQIKLRDILLQTKTRIVRTMNPSPVQDRLEATLSSLASLSPVPAPAKPRAVPKVIPERAIQTPTTAKPSSSFLGLSKPQAAASAPAAAAQPSASIPPPAVEKSVPSSPLASLNSIVAQIGGSGDKKPSIPSSKSQPLQFSMGLPFSQGFEAPEKSNLSSNLQLGKPVAQVSVQPAGSQPPAPFSKILNVSFGSGEQKSGENASNSRESASKTESISFGSKDAQSAASTSLFSEGLFKTSGLTITKTQQSPPQGQGSTLGPGLSISFKENPAATTQSVFSFASPPAFSTPAATVPSSSQGALDLSGLTVGLSGKTAADTTSTTSMFGKLSIPTPNLAFGKFPSGPTASAAPTASPGAPAAPQEVKVSVSLPAGTTIEKQPVTTSSTPVSSPLFGTSKPSGSIFGGQSGLSSSMFGGAAASTFPTPTSLPSTFNSPQPAAPAATTAPAFAASPFSPASVTTAPATTVSPFGGSPTFSSALNTGMSSLNFGKLTSSGDSAPAASIFGMSFAAPTTSSPGSIFGQASSVPSSSTAGSIFGKASSTTTASGSIFGQPSTVSPVTTASGSIFGGASTTTTPSGSIFGQPSTISPVTTASGPIFGGGGLPQGQTSPAGGIFGAQGGGNSIFGGSPGPSAGIFGGGGQAPAAEGGSIFGGAPAAPFGSPTSPSMFGGAKPTGGSIFGGSATFGSPMGPPTSPPAPAFGGAPAFGAKPVFGAAQPVFGSPKPEFGGNAFGGQPTFGNPGGFTTSPTMGGSPGLGAPAMGKVFGSPGNSTFESLAGQNGGMTFGSLAQKSPEKPPPPAFSGGSSFSSWR
ncbi:nuclear pore complex protein Nup214 [Diachasma alloeum]|uniref:nuclear pore complex protein Nup214 n=1 Tax=Diachasma alloeum TaxID=454923 RepID=UPI0007383260|nr:nuclear pore complex protein Nup214 [Diachasma alloeum]